MEEKKKRFKVVAIHYTQSCNLKCPFCYKQSGTNTMDRKFMMSLPTHLIRITNQCALGGGEPTLFPDIVKEFASECKKHKLICNLTTNGTQIDLWSDEQVKDVFKDVTMVSISIDNYKVNTMSKFTKYMKRAERMKRLGVKTGANLMLDDAMFQDRLLIKISDLLFQSGIERIFMLYPKGVQLETDVIEYLPWFMDINAHHEHVYFDDVLHEIFKNKSYSNWSTGCQRGKDIISLDWDGSISACSFAPPFIKITKPWQLDNLRIPRNEKGVNYCPYILRR